MTCYMTKSGFSCLNTILKHFKKWALLDFLIFFLKILFPLRKLDNQKKSDICLTHRKGSIGQKAWAQTAMSISVKPN